MPCTGGVPFCDNGYLDSNEICTPFPVGPPETSAPAPAPAQCVVPSHPADVSAAAEAALACFGLWAYIDLTTFQPTAGNAGLTFTIDNLGGFENALNTDLSLYFGSDPWYFLHVGDVCFGGYRARLSCVLQGQIDSWRSFIDPAMLLFGSLQIVINNANAAGYADIDACNTQDVVNIGCHLGGMIGNGIRGIFGPRTAPMPRSTPSAPLRYTSAD